MKRKDLLYWIWASLAMGAGGRGFDVLINTFGGPDELFFAEEIDRARFPGVSKSAIAALSKKDLSRAIEILDACEKQGISILTYTDDRYPDTLRGIDNAPVLLYYRGHLPDMNGQMCIAMVGTRSMTEYGMDAAYKIAYETAKANAVIVSGMAEGIDGVCSAAALAAKGETVVVFGSGVDVVYPKEHKKLCEEICKRGAVVSEYPPGERPLGYHFPLRNRLISGMAQATVVIEAGERSGALITAQRALEQGRRVYAMTMPEGSKNAKGTRSLLESGAKPLIGAENIISDYAHIYPKTLRVRHAPETYDGGADRTLLARLGVIPSDAQEIDTSSKERSFQEIRRREKRAASSVRKEPKLQSPGTPFPGEEELSSMPPIEADILRCFQKEAAVSAEFFYTLPYQASEISVALTCLEISGKIKKAPGSVYERC